MNHPENSPAPASTHVAPHPVIQYIGRSCFLIVAPDGTRIITDPYSRAVEHLPFPVGVKADLVTVSHGLDDHFQVQAIQGHPAIISEAISDQVGLVKVTSYDSLRGRQNGIHKGINKIFVFQIGAIKIVHLGELGEIEFPEVYEAIKDADVMLVPADQASAMSFDQLNKLVALTNARTVIPHHFGVGAARDRRDMSTVKEYIAALPPGTVIVEADKLAVVPNMPKQVVVLALIALENQRENLSISERTCIDLTQDDAVLQTTLCNHMIDYSITPHSSADTFYQSLWMGSLRPKVTAWIDSWKHRPPSPYTRN